MQDYAARDGKRNQQHFSACRAHTLLKQLTQQTPITIDGLPAFVPASRWVIDPHDHWVSTWACWQVAFSDKVLSAIEH